MSTGPSTRSFWLLVGKAVQMGSGFLFWVIAARAASLTAMGVAATACAAVMLCTQLGGLGTGAAVVVRVGRRAPSRQTFDLAFTLLTVASILVTAEYLGILVLLGSTALIPQPLGWFAVAFVIAVVAGAATVCLDQASLVFHRAHGPLTRYAAGSAVSTVALCVLASRPGSLSALAVFVCWSTSGVVAMLVGLTQLRRWIGYSYRPALWSGGAVTMLRIGLPNQLLTITERMLPALLPLILTHAASPEVTALWYPAWMMAWVVFTVPLSAGMVQFADAILDPAGAGRAARRSLVWSVTVGSAIAVPLGAMAEVLLGVMGEAYADGSATALRILLLGLVAVTVLQGYNAACRAEGRLAEATGLGLGLAVAVCSCAAWLGPAGVEAVAWGWVGATGTAAVIAALRLRALVTVPPRARVPHHSLLGARR